MVEIKNQKEFNENFTKEKSVIRFRDEDNFQGQLIVEDYPNLKKLYLRSVKSVDKVFLKNLTKLQELTILECNTKELVINDCPQIKKINIEKNPLTNLEFIEGLENLEELKVDGNTEIVSGLEHLPGNWEKFSYENTKLTEVLKIYGNDWKTCKKDTQEIFDLSTKQDFQGLIKKFWDLKKSREDLKRDVSDVTGHSTTSKPIKTVQLVLDLGKEFKEKEERINYLEFQIWELTELSEKLKEKIQSYLDNFDSEKGLLGKLIKSYLEFIKFKNQEDDPLDDYDEKYKRYEEQYREFEKQLWAKLTKEKKSEVRRVLVDCEKLLNREQEKGEKLGDSKSLKNEILSQVSSDNREETNRQLKLAKTNEQLRTHQEQPMTQQVINYINCNIVNAGDNSTFINQYNFYYQQLADEIKKEIIEPLTNLKVTEQDKQVINKTIIFWGVQELFFNYRKNTIDKLIDCYCRLANKTRVTKKWTTRINSVMGITSKIVKSVPNGSIAETPLGIVGDIAVLTDTILEDKYLGKCIEDFKEIIKKDSKDLIFFDQSYDSLYKTIWNNNQPLSPTTTKIVEVLDLVKEKPYPFSEGQNIYQASDTRQEYFTSLNFNSEQLKTFLEKLDKNLVELCQSFEKQKKQLNEQEWFKTIDRQTDLLQEQKVEEKKQFQVEQFLK